MFKGFERARIETPGATINLLRGGDGPPLLLLHGYPQTHVMWHKVAPELARHFTVVAPDLRGYGDSDKPAGGGDHAAYSKRAMAEDQVRVMAALGFERFDVVGHDRGARVGHRLVLDHPDRVRRQVVLDVVATDEIFANVDARLATAYFHWFMMLQPEPLAETLIGNATEFYMRWLMGRWCTVPGAVTEEAFTEYFRCFNTPEAVHAACEDYRAAPLDIAHNEVDRGRMLECPILVLWGGAQTQHPGWPSMSLDILETWRRRATDVRGRGLACGHFLPEEAPEETTAEILAFLRQE
jgi:haloacetate dehalogenase